MGDGSSVVARGACSHAVVRSPCHTLATCSGKGFSSMRERKYPKVRNVSDSSPEHQRMTYP